MIGDHRNRLRSATRCAHRDLEAVIGDVDSISAYRRYIRGLYCFRAPLETAVVAKRFDDWGDWRPMSLAGLLLQDIADLDADESEIKMAGMRSAVAIESAPVDPPLIFPPLVLPSMSESAQIIGALYVLEGATLGAQILARNAHRFGLSQTYGARHLIRQSGAIGHWRQFVDILERHENLDMTAAQAAAISVFECARRAFAQADHFHMSRS